MMFAQSQLVWCISWNWKVFSSFFNPNINPHVFFWVTVSHIVQTSASSNRFESGFHYACFKSTSFDATLEICRSFDFLIYCLNLPINLDFFGWGTVRHIVQQTAASNRFECGFHDVCSKPISFFVFFETDMSSQFPLCFNSSVNPKVCFSCCKPHRSKNDRFKSLRVWVPLYLL